MHVGNGDTLTPEPSSVETELPLLYSCKWKQNCKSTQIGKIMQPF